MPKARTSKKGPEKPDDTILEMARSEQVSGENNERSGRVPKLYLSSVHAKPNNAAGPEHHWQDCSRLPEQLHLYEEPSGADHSQQARASRRPSAIVIRCPLCRSNLRVAAIALTIECRSCRAIVDVLEVAPVKRIGVGPPSGRLSNSVPPQVEPRLQAAAPTPTEGPPRFFAGPLPAIRQAPAAATSAIRKHAARTLWIALGAAVLLGGLGGVGYWRIYPKQPQTEPETATPLKTTPTVATPVLAIVSTQHRPQLVIGLPQLADKQPLDEPVTSPAAEPPVAAPAAEASTPVLEAGVPQAFVPTNIALAPADDVFVVRFDSKLPGLTPSGLRALDAALRAATKGRKVRVTIAGCAAHDSISTGIDCVALTRSLKSILAHRGVDHPTDLIVSPSPPTIMFPW